MNWTKLLSPRPDFKFLLLLLLCGGEIALKQLSTTILPHRAHLKVALQLIDNNCMNSSPNYASSGADSCKWSRRAAPSTTFTTRLPCFAVWEKWYMGLTLCVLRCQCSAGSHLWAYMIMSPNSKSVFFSAHGFLVISCHCIRYLSASTWSATRQYPTSPPRPSPYLQPPSLQSECVDMSVHPSSRTFLSGLSTCIVLSVYAVCLYYISCQPVLYGLSIVCTMLSALLSVWYCMSIVCIHYVVCLTVCMVLHGLSIICTVCIVWSVCFACTVYCMVCLYCFSL